MNPQDIYKSRNSTGWSRIDMLIALYDGTIDRLSLAHTALQDNADQLTATTHLARAQRLVIEILAGLNDGYGELPQRIQQLCVFVSDCITDGSADKIQAAIRVLSNLRDGFREIRDEAIELERQGQIPAIDESPEFQATA